MKKNYIVSTYMIILFGLCPFVSYGQSIVINEVVTDPQQDWSTNGFNGVPAAGTISAVDEYLELFIKVSGLDLTGWTIELLDGSDVIGDLTNTGAFDVSNYISEGSGTFSNTEVGDYLVLGNVDGSGAMNNSITINLKNSGGTIIDTVTLGGGTGEAPNGNASSMSNEAVIRTLNGNDSNIDSADFTQGSSSMGASNSSTVNWLGKTDNDWNTSSNWAGNSLPGTGADVLIVNGLPNYPTSSSSTTVNTVALSSGSSFIAQSTFTGTLTYYRSIGTTNWYLAGIPVAGESIEDMISNNSFASGTSSNIGWALYDNSQAAAADRWDYQTASSTGSLTSGGGYSVKLSSAGALTFTGNMETSDVGVAIADNSGGSGNSFNLVGNPYPSFIAANTNADGTNNLLSINSSDLTEQTLWLWNQSLGTYETFNQASSALYIAPAQGFFVSSNGSNTFNFTEAMQSHQTTDTFRNSDPSSRPEIELQISDGSSTKKSVIFYINGTTTGFDNGYDSSMFNGASNAFAIYTHLVSDSQGQNLAIQSLPPNNYENMIIPIGINSTSGTEITISANSTNLPDGLKIYLEDKQDNSFILLDDTSEFTTTLSIDMEGTGRFYLHTSYEALSLEDIQSTHFGIYMSRPDNLVISGVQSSTATVKMYNLLGMEVFAKTFMGAGNNDLPLPNFNKGIYIVKLETQFGSSQQKVIIE